MEFDQVAGEGDDVFGLEVQARVGGCGAGGNAVDYACGVDGRGGNGDGVGEGREKSGREDHGGREREHGDFFIWSWVFLEIWIYV